VRVVEYDRYGPPSVLEVRERDAPSKDALRSREVLIRVRAAALNPKDVLTRSGKYRWASGFHFPRRVGYDWAGEAIAVGTGVTDIREGDTLFGMIQAWAAGACAEMVVARRDELAPIAISEEEVVVAKDEEKKVTWESAAALPLAGCTALQALRDDGALESGKESRVIINGASGGVGSLAIQIAKELGAAHITTLTSHRNRDLARSLGADDAQSYEGWDPATAKERYDVFFDVFGNRKFADVKHLLTPSGTFVSTVPKRHVIVARFMTAFTRPRARLVVVRSRSKDLEWLADAAARGAIRPLIDRVLPLDQIVAAQEHLATKRARGKVVLSITK
jgi:NADPH:quinone reductase-like Zn-dependent oxidoreductase